MYRMTLNSTSDIDHRINLIKSLINNSLAKIEHLDNLRQKNFVVTIAVFAGIFGYVLQAKSLIIALTSAIILTFLMLVFLLIEKNLSKYNEGWQSTNIKLTILLHELINEPKKDYTFLRYDCNKESQVKFKGYKAWLHYILVIGGPISFILYIFS